MVSVKSVLDMMKCSVCQEVVKIPFKQCKTGHLVCNPCSKSLKQCPICNEAEFQENSVCLKNILQFLPRPCPHFGNGCGLVVRLDDSHKSFCKFRGVDCKFVRCRERLPLSTLSEHHEKRHGNYSRQTEIPYIPFNGKIQCVGWHLPQCKFVNKTHVFAHDHVVFLLELLRRGPLCEQSFYMYPFGRQPEDDYLILLALRKGDLKLDITLRANRECENDQPSCTIKLHISTLAQFANEKDHVEVLFDIFSQPKSVVDNQKS